VVLLNRMHEGFRPTEGNVNPDFIDVGRIEQAQKLAVGDASMQLFDYASP